MFRRMIAAMIVVMSLSLALVAPAAAEPEYDTDYEVRDVSLISEGDVRSFHRVETYEQGLSWNQANELCQDLGFDEAIGIDRERYSGEGRPRARYDVVTCAGEGEPAVVEFATVTVATFASGPGISIPYPVPTITVFEGDDADVEGNNGICAGQPVASGSTLLGDATFELEVGQTYCFEADSGIVLFGTDVQRYTVTSAGPNVVNLIFTPVA